MSVSLRILFISFLLLWQHHCSVADIEVGVIICGHYVCKKAFDCNMFYHTTEISTDQKVRRAITEMVRLPYYFSTITSTLHSSLQGSVCHLALTNECFPCFLLFPILLFFFSVSLTLFSLTLYLISVLEPCLLLSTFFIAEQLLSLSSLYIPSCLSNDYMIVNMKPPFKLF